MGAALNDLALSTKVCALIAFALVLAAVVALILTGNDPGTLVSAGVTVAGLFGLGAHQASQSKTIAKIDKQTNGVLTSRIKDAVSAALAEQAPAKTAAKKSTTTTK